MKNKLPQIHREYRVAQRQCDFASRYAEEFGHIIMQCNQCNEPDFCIDYRPTPEGCTTKKKFEKARDCALEKRCEAEKRRAIAIAKARKNGISTAVETEKSFITAVFKQSDDLKEFHTTVCQASRETQADHIKLYDEWKYPSAGMTRAPEDKLAVLQSLIVKHTKTKLQDIREMRDAGLEHLVQY